MECLDNALSTRPAKRRVKHHGGDGAKYSIYRERENAWQCGKELPAVDRGLMRVPSGGELTVDTLAQRQQHQQVETEKQHDRRQTG